jgi:hypothetical protein
MSFTRRLTNPSVDVITQVSGVVLVNTPPPGTISGAGSGNVGMVGEFVDGTYAVQFNGIGEFVTKPTPVQIFSGADLIAKLGGFRS